MLSSVDNQNIIKFRTSIEELVKQKMSQYDPSHDWLHIERVRRNALSIAKTLPNVNLIVVEFAALLHDFNDYKYEKEGDKSVKILLTELGLSKDLIDTISIVIDGISYSKNQNNNVEITPELACVRDADRLDAIGAIGIARCIAFSGSQNRPLYSPIDFSAPDSSTAVGHFYEKLLKLESCMCTAEGKRLAKKRTEFVGRFLEELRSEVE